MTTIITPIAAGDEYADVKANLVTLVEFWLGSGAASGGNTPSTWADIRASLNEIATVLGVSTVGAGDSGATARAKINAINDLSTLPDIGDLLARYTTPATDDRAKLNGKLIYDLKDGGVWTKLDVLYLTAAADAQAARRNWIADAHNLTTVNSPSFTADRGYTGNGSSSYLNTNYNPGDGGSYLYQQNNAHLAVWSRTNSDGLFVDLGARVGASSARSNLLTRSGGVCSILINQDTAETAASGDSSGHQLTRRIASNATAVFRNASSLGTGSTASVAPANLAWFMGALNNNGTAAQFSARELAVGHAGASLSDGEITAMHAALSTYLTAIGAA